jgi:hypothetical protein
MSENTETQAEPAPASDPAASARIPAGEAPTWSAPVAVPDRRRSLWPALGLVGFLVLAAGEGYLYHLDQTADVESGRIAAMQSQIAALQQTSASGVPTTPDADVDALGPKLAAVEAQVNALQTLFTADHGALIALQANATDLTKLTADVNALQARATADHAVLTGLQASTTDLAKLTAKISVLGRLDAARMALDAGQPLGDIPNAPPALAKFSAAPPPTQAELVLSFPAAAEAAESASVTRDGKRSYWSNVLARLEGLVTISNGTHVIVGAPAAAVIAQARASLDAGDLAGAVAVLDTLSVSTQAAMGDWLSQARDLLAARAAIVSLAAN